MGIISSTFLSLAVQLAWNCQRFLDPRYRYIEPKVSSEDSSNSVSCPFVNKNDGQKKSEGTIIKRGIVDGGVQNTGRHQEHRKRRATQLRYRRRRRSSFDAAFIIHSMNKNGVIAPASHRITSSTPNTLTRQQAPAWNTSSTLSSSSTSSASSTTSSSPVSSGEESDIEDNVQMDRGERTSKNILQNAVQCKDNIDNSDDMSGERHTMTAAEEAAFRLTVGRGHFTKSKKDRFLNDLRLEKRLNDLNREFFELTGRTHSRSLYRHHSGDLRKII